MKTDRGLRRLMAAGGGAVGWRKEKNNPENCRIRWGRRSRYKGCNNSNGDQVQRGHCPRLEHHHLIIWTYLTHWWPVTHVHNQ